VEVVVENKIKMVMKMQIKQNLIKKDMKELKLNLAKVVKVNLLKMIKKKTLLLLHLLNKNKQVKKKKKNLINIGQIK